MEDIKGKAIRSHITHVRSFLTGLLQVAESIDLEQSLSGERQRALFFIAKQLANASLLLKRHSRSSSLPIDGTVEAGEQILRLVHGREDHVATQALIGVGLALKGDLGAALTKMEDVMQVARAAIAEGLEQVQGLDPTNHRYVEDISRLLQAVIECGIEAALDHQLPAKGEQTHRHILLRSEMSRLRMSLDTASPGPEVLAAPERIKRLLRRLLSCSLILPFASRDYQDTQRALDDLFTALTRPDCQELISSAIAYTDPEVRTQALLALGFGLARLDRLDEAISVYVKADQAGVKLPERFARKLIRLGTTGGNASSMKTIMDVFQRQAVDPSTGLIRLEEQSYLVIGSFLGRRGQVDRLRLLWQRFLEQYPKHAGSWALKHNFLEAYGRSNDFALFERHLNESWILPGSGETNHRKKTFDNMTYMTVINAYVRFGRMDEAERLLGQLQGKHREDILLPAHNAVLRGHFRVRDTAKAGALWSKMVQQGPEPSRITYDLMIKTFARRGDLPTAFDFLHLMQQEGFAPSPHILPLLMSKLVRSGEYAKAETMFRSMLRNPHVQTDVRAWNCMLESLVYRNSPLKKVLSAFEETKKQALAPDGRTYALLLTSACDANAIRTAEHIFAEADYRGAQPDAATGDRPFYVPQNTVFSGDEQQPGVAQQTQLRLPLENFSDEPQRRPLRFAPSRRTNVSHFSILIYTHLRLGNVTAAKEYFDELQRRRVGVPAITWSILVKAYIDSGSQANMRLARDIILRQLGEADDDKGDVEDGQDADEASNARRSRHRNAQILYAPLLTYSAKQGDSNKVEAILSELDRDGVPLSLSTLSIALDCYRQKSDLAPMISIWNRIFEKATEKANDPHDFNLDMPSSTPTSGSAALYSGRRAARRGDTDSRLSQVKVSAVRRNALCLPLSIMLDALASEDRHEEIAEIWSEVRSAGFAFDPYNWNQLAAALASAGRTEDALRVLENVLNQLNPTTELQRLILKGRLASRRGRGKRQDGDQGEQSSAKGTESTRDDAQTLGLSRGPTRRMQREISGGQVFTGEPPRPRSSSLDEDPSEEGEDFWDPCSAAADQAGGSPAAAAAGSGGDAGIEERREILRLLDEQNLLDQKRPFWKAQRNTLLQIEASLLRFSQQQQGAPLGPGSGTGAGPQPDSEPQFSDGAAATTTTTADAGATTADLALLQRYPRAAEILDAHRAREAFVRGDELSRAERSRRSMGAY
jgi:pentatricopeptide repeat protein